jgi:hypothetical protein
MAYPSRSLPNGPPGSPSVRGGQPGDGSRTMTRMPTWTMSSARPRASFWSRAVMGVKSWVVRTLYARHDYEETAPYEGHGKADHWFAKAL